MSLNKALLIGRLGRDPEVRYAQNGNQITTCSIATSETYKDKQGQKQEKTEWVNLIFFGKLAEIAGKYLTKGSEVFVEGKITTRKWQGQDGVDKYTTEIVVSEMKMMGGKPQGQQAGQQQRHQPGSGYDDFDPDIPF